MSKIIDQLRATPTSLEVCIGAALGMFKGKIHELPPFLATHVKDYAAQKFQAAMLRAEQAGNATEAQHLMDLFTSIYGKPGEKYMNADLQMWVIYWNPADYPGEHVARMHSAKDGASSQVVKGTIEELRERFDTMGLVNIGRYTGDDPCIVEVWI